MFTSWAKSATIGVTKIAARNAAEIAIAGAAANCLLSAEAFLSEGCFRLKRSKVRVHFKMHWGVGSL